MPSDPSSETSHSELQAWQKGLRERAFRLLAMREHSRHELAEKLFKPRNSPSKHQLLPPPEDLSSQAITTEIQTLLDKLEANDLLSDARFAETLTRQYLRKGKGLLALKQAYQQHQLDRAITQPLLEGLSHRWQEQAYRVREKRFGNQPPADQKEAAKMQRFLASRGFTPEQIRKAVFLE
ncbi:regulatory protein [Marinospirillum celere]|uniref:Regulatory protein RecX n=1 Tax=Marinospirillum celere TaxID=1122252 RepID=A0A1I1FJA1_9GAMM|nr:regulatory protein RecX [Marinospirillum celere]SFB99415.1 regulatory protein [Marinospirillum celere]